MIVVWLAAIFVASWILTEKARRYALAKDMVDRPNERTSHTGDIPRGGGIGITVSFIIATVILWFTGHASSALAATILLGGSLVAVVGFIDDAKSLSAKTRILAHFGAAVWALLCIGCPNSIDAGFAVIQGAVPIWLFFLVAIAWLINSYNFMDGIDGIAGGTAAAAALGGASLMSIYEMPLPLSLAAAALGFLVLNWPPARIFMGDVASGFLGYVFSAFWLYTTKLEPDFFWVWPTLLGVFLVDATITLIWRFCKGEKWYAPHRSHAYQHASRRWGHKTVTLATLAIELFWLLPASIFIRGTPHYGALICVTALLPIALACIALKTRYAS